MLLNCKFVTFPLKVCASWSERELHALLIKKEWRFACFAVIERGPKRRLQNRCEANCRLECDIVGRRRDEPSDATLMTRPAHNIN